MKKYKRIISFMVAIVLMISILPASTLAYKVIVTQGHVCKGVYNGSITFKSWSGFTTYTRYAIDYASRQWNNKTGVTKLYHSPTQHNTNIMPTADGQSLITKVSLANTVHQNAPMWSYVRFYIINGYAYIFECDIAVNADKDWANNGAADKLDVQNAMTHEFGHMLGLDDIDTPLDATMYKSTCNGETSKRTLSQDDLNGFAAIYS